MIRDFCDGEDFRQHQPFGTDLNALILHCYYDEYQVTNPLGSKTRNHKIGIKVKLHLFQHRSAILPTLDHAYGLLRIMNNYLHKVVLINKYGIDKILQPFMEDLSVLESVSEYVYLVNELRVISCKYVSFAWKCFQRMFSTF